MSKYLSLYSLIGLLLLVGILFYRVVEPFLVVLFVSVVLAVLVEPVQKWIKDKLNGRRRTAAAITTTLLLLVIILPIGGALLLAGGQMVSSGQQVMKWLEQSETPSDDESDAGADIESSDRTPASSESQPKGESPSRDAPTSDAQQSLETEGGLQNVVQEFNDSPFVQRLLVLYHRFDAGQKARIQNGVSSVVTGFVADLYDRTTGLVGNIVQAGIGLFILTLAVFYFLADGREFMKEVRRLLPLEQGEEDELFDQFQAVCRGVILGTLAAGLAQAVLAGIAFGLIGVDQVWLLIVLTMICSFIPFVGAVAVWAPVAAALALDGQWGAAIGLAIFGFFVISTADNLIRAYVIGGEARLHPLIALVSVLGALQLIGLWGIFIGPMIAALFYSIAHLLRRRILASQAA